MEQPPKKSIVVLKVIQSVIAAMFGVQKKKHMETDFTINKPAYYIVAGAIFLVFIIMAMLLLVKTVLSSH